MPQNLAPRSSFSAVHCVLGAISFPIWQHGIYMYMYELIIEIERTDQKVRNAHLRLKIELLIKVLANGLLGFCLSSFPTHPFSSPSPTPISSPSLRQARFKVLFTVHGTHYLVTAGSAEYCWYFDSRYSFIQGAGGIVGWREASYF